MIEEVCQEFEAHTQASFLYLSRRRRDISRKSNDDDGGGDVRSPIAINARNRRDSVATRRVATSPELGFLGDFRGDGADDSRPRTGLDSRFDQRLLSGDAAAENTPSATAGEERSGAGEMTPRADERRSALKCDGAPHRTAGDELFVVVGRGPRCHIAAASRRSRARRRRRGVSNQDRPSSATSSSRRASPTTAESAFHPASTERRRGGGH